MRAVKKILFHTPDDEMYCFVAVKGMKIGTSCRPLTADNFVDGVFHHAFSDEITGS